MAFSLFSRPTVKTISPGLYHFDIRDVESKSRIHLRLDEDLSGLLVVNAAKIIHLNSTAGQMAYLHLNKVEHSTAIRTMQRLFNVKLKELEADYSAITARIDAMIDENSDLCPICDLGIETNMPFSAHLSAPYRMDLALTYRCNNNCAHCYNARPRNYPELDTKTWKQIIDKVWNLRIPHVVFTGGEPTLRPDLAELIDYAQSKGMVTGLNTNARALKDGNLVQQLVAAGLDHVQITVESYSPAIHDEIVRAQGAWQDTLSGLRNVVNSRLYLMTNTTLLENNAGELDRILHFLAEEHVPTIGLNALIYSGRGAKVKTGLKETELPALLQQAIDFTNASGQRLIWYTPTEYCHFDPTQLALGVKGCSAAYYNMCVEPDGQVIPCQSYYTTLGSILETDWDSIWNHPLALQLRERRNAPEGCRQCDYFLECGGGCPMAREHQTITPILKPI